MTTRAPSLAKLMAIARPMPELAPVTTAIFPASRLDIGFDSTLRQQSPIIQTSGLVHPILEPSMPDVPLPDIDLAASLFDGLSAATRRGHGIVRDSYG